MCIRDSSVGSNRRQNYNQSLTDWGSPMGDVPDDGVVPPRTNINSSLPSPYQDRIMNEDLMRIQQNRGNIDRGFLDGITGPVMGGLKWLGEKFKRPEAKQRFYDEVMQGRSVEPWQTGTYKGNQYGLYNSPSGLKVSSDVLGWGEGLSLIHI